MVNVEPPSRKGYFILTLVGIGLAVLCAIAAMMAGIGSRLGLWHFRTGFEILRIAGYASIVAVLLSALGPVLSPTKKMKSFALAVPGVVVAVAVLVILVNLWSTSRTVPPIHDITTDIVNPPQFVTLAKLRSNAVNPAKYGGPEVAIKQLQAYPDIKPLVFDIPADRAFDEAVVTAGKMGWHIVDAAKREGRIEATDTTFWFGFTDDIVIRITPAGTRSIIDVRSVSRVGRSDQGKNAERIRSFFRQLRET